MEKLLAMSILSSSPADISGGWTTSVTRKREKSEGCGEKKSSNCKVGEQGRVETRKSPHSSHERPSFAVEFDGLNFFETLVSH